MNEKLLNIAVQYGAYKLGCERALELLENGDAEPADADKVIKLLREILCK
jgi:ribosomal protein L30E